MEETNSYQTEEQAHFDHFYNITWVSCLTTHTLSFHLSHTNIHTHTHTLILPASYMDSYKRVHAHVQIHVSG